MVSLIQPASPRAGKAHYQHHQPERALLYQLVEHAALLVDDILPQAPYRQSVLSVPFQLRFLFANKPEVMSKALGIAYFGL
jgi:hypothetical protein